MRIIYILFLVTTLSITEEINKNLSPFGINLGHKFDKNIQISELKENIFIVNPSKPISYFSEYLVFVDKNQLVSKVVAISDKFKDDDYCHYSKSIYSKLEDTITEKYGKSQHNFDFLLIGAIWKESRDYKMSLIKNERTHYTTWLINKIFYISLEEDADVYGCYIKLSYQKNDLIDAIIQDKDKKDSDSL